MRPTYKSRPTIFSKTELFPLDCDPTTAIWGKSMGFCTCAACQLHMFVIVTAGLRYEAPRDGRRTPTVVKTSWSLLTSVISVGSLTLMLQVVSYLRRGLSVFELHHGGAPTQSG